MKRISALFTSLLLLTAAAYANACSCVGERRIEYFYYAPQAAAPSAQHLDQLDTLTSQLRHSAQGDSRRLDSISLTGYAVRPENSTGSDKNLALKRARRLREALIYQQIPAQKITVDNQPLSHPVNTEKKLTDGVEMTIRYVADCSCPSVF